VSHRGVTGEGKREGRGGGPESDRWLSTVASPTASKREREPEDEDIVRCAKGSL
jgi:hypothetical protein